MSTAFCGIDPGRWGGVACLVGQPTGLDVCHGGFHVQLVRLAPLPVRPRDDGGHELDARATARLLARRDGEDLRRLVVERPAFGGQARRPADVLRQGATVGGVMAVAELSTPNQVDEARADSRWREELGLEGVRESAARKLANIAEAERLLGVWLAGGAELEVYGATIAKGYTGRLPGPADTRSGIADAVLLAWLGVRRWLGLSRRTR